MPTCFFGLKNHKPQVQPNPRSDLGEKLTDKFEHAKEYSDFTDFFALINYTHALSFVNLYRKGQMMEKPIKMCPFIS